MKPIINVEAADHLDQFAANELHSLSHQHLSKFSLELEKICAYDHTFLSEEDRRAARSYVKKLRKQRNHFKHMIEAHEKTIENMSSEMTELKQKLFFEELRHSDTKRNLQSLSELIKEIEVQRDQALAYAEQQKRSADDHKLLCDAFESAYKTQLNELIQTKTELDESGKI